MAKRQLKDFLNNRKARGHEWPTKSLIYSWRFFNFHGFNERCVSALGRKLFIDEEAFESWLIEAMNNPQQEKLREQRTK